MNGQVAERTQVSSTWNAAIPALLVATFTTGVIDAVSVLGLGRVFTANMTGNVVFLGFALAGVPGYSMARAGVALVAFLAGAVVGGLLARTFAHSRPHRWLAIASAFEAVTLLGAAILALGFDRTQLEPVGFLYLLIALTAVAMGVRNATARRIAVPDLTTTVLTLTITGLGADSWLAGGSSPRLGRRLGAVIAMLAGAAAGALLVLALGVVVPLAASSALTLIAAGLYFTQPSIGVEV
ncbi:MAG TPA: YoaK family protein [Gemmatimonadales bacterium]|nr:YoaK family protein [Gemmatimonadales bacterium]